VAELVPTQFEIAYGWANLTQGDFFYSIAPDGSGREVRLESSTRALGISPTDARFVRRIDIYGRLFISTDSGKHWQQRAHVPFTTFEESVSDAAFSPSDPMHLVVGSDTGAWLTTNGGDSWSKSSGLTIPGGRVTVGQLALAPSNTSIVWASGIDITENDTNPPRGYRLWRSEDGGLSFTAVFDRSDATTPTIFGNLVPHPTNTNIVYWHIANPAFGVVELYKFDLTTGLVTTIAPPGIYGIRSMAFHPELPAYMYFGLYWPG
jgi:photosystem II stability/assembly factor-like uncharacterized protein